MRTRYIQDRATGELLLASEYHESRGRTHYVMGDLPDYESPVDGRIVHGRKGRREDLRRTGSRPYEGREQEWKESQRHRAYEERRQDTRLDAAVRTAYHQLTPGQRRELEKL